MDCTGHNYKLQNPIYIWFILLMIYQQFTGRPQSPYCAFLSKNFQGSKTLQIHQIQHSKNPGLNKDISVSETKSFHNIQTHFSKEKVTLTAAKLPGEVPENKAL